MIIVQHLFVLFLAIGMPLWDRYEIPRLKTSTAPRKKVLYYRKIVAALWLCAAWAVLTIGLVPTFTVHRSPGEISWLAPRSRGGLFFEGITAGILTAILLPAIMAFWNPKIRIKAAKAAKPLAFLLPSSREERGWWWLVCISAGVCEEIIYRGFLLHYFHTQPFHLSLTWTLLVASLIFGVGHLYQGIANAVQTLIIGFVFGGIFLLTGNLLLPIVIHAIMDLRALAILPEGFDSATALPESAGPSHAG